MKEGKGSIEDMKSNSGSAEGSPNPDFDMRWGGGGSARGSVNDIGVLVMPYLMMPMRNIRMLLSYPLAGH